MHYYNITNTHHALLDIDHHRPHHVHLKCCTYILRKYARKLSIERLFFYISIRLWGRVAVTIKTTFSYTYIYIIFTYI